MHVHFLDPYQEKSSPIHRLDVRVKLALAVAFILTTALVPTGVWPIYILLLAILLSAEVLSELGIRFYLKRALLALPFILAALPVLFTIEGSPLIHLPLGLVITVPGVDRFISVALKSWLSVQMAVMLASTTTFPDLLASMRSWHLPRILVAIIGLMWRYLFVMVDETFRLIHAREARSAESDIPGYKPGGKLIWRARVTGGMAGSLFLRSLERSDRIYMAMLARGYDGEIRSMPRAPVRPAEYGILAAGIVILGALLILGILMV